jgi:hypothetical protein
MADVRSQGRASPGKRILAAGTCRAAGNDKRVSLNPGLDITESLLIAQERLAWRFHKPSFQLKQCQSVLKLLRAAPAES